MISCKIIVMTAPLSCLLIEIVCVCQESIVFEWEPRVCGHLPRHFLFCISIEFRFSRKERKGHNGIATVQCSRIYFNPLYKVYSVTN